MEPWAVLRIIHEKDKGFVVNDVFVLFMQSGVQLKIKLTFKRECYINYCLKFKLQDIFNLYMIWTCLLTFNLSIIKYQT